MKHGLITSGLVATFALALSTAAAIAQPVIFGGSPQQPLSAVSSPLMLVHGGGGHGSGFSGGHGSAGGHMGFSRGGGRSFAFSGIRHDHRGRGFAGSGYDGYYGYEDGCWFSRRYGRWVCPNYY
jgi:hypothetical protein